jgi:hypothetical protein
MDKMLFVVKIVGTKNPIAVGLGLLIHNVCQKQYIGMQISIKIQVKGLQQE